LLQAADEKFEEATTDLKKLHELLGHHIKGSQNAKTRYEAMLG